MPSKTKQALIVTAIALAKEVLANEDVRRRLAAAPAGVMDWASARRASMKAAGGSSLDPRNHFGHRSLERRIIALQANVDKAFPDPAQPGRAEVLVAVNGLRTALDVSERMPLVERTRAHSRISKELDGLEKAMVDAVLPSTRSIGPATG
jgi:hypothetical protein